MFKAGDRVRIKEVVATMEAKECDFINEEMRNMGGMEFMIESCRHSKGEGLSNSYNLEGSRWTWYEYLLESADKPKDKIAGNHYKTNNIEVIDIIEEFNLNFNLGNVVKYILRAGKKGSETREEDLAKAVNYAHRELTGEWI